MRGMSALEYARIIVVLVLAESRLHFLAANTIAAGSNPSDSQLKITDLAKEGDSHLLLFSTISGNLYAVERETGEIKWKIRDRTITPAKERPDPYHTIFLPNPVDGSLYVIANEHIRKLDFTIPQLVSSSPCRSTEGILYSGKKKDSWFLIDPHTGDHQQILGWDVLHGPTCPVDTPDAIYIGRSMFSLSMVDVKQPHRRWNVSFYDYTSEQMSKEAQATYNMIHFASSSTGQLISLDRRRGSVNWIASLDSPIIGAYIYHRNGLVSVPFTTVSKQILMKLVDNLDDDDKTVAIPTQIKLYPSLHIGRFYALPSYVDQNSVTIANDEGRMLLLEGAEGNEKPAKILMDYPQLGQDYVLPHNSITNIVTFQTMPSQRRSFSCIVYLGHYDVLKRSSDTILLSNHYSEQRLIADGSAAQQVAKDDMLETRTRNFQASFTILLVVLFGGGIVQVCMNAWKARAKAAIETPDGCIRIGKICFDKAQLLGKGCEGTFVYRGEFEGRRVAVKRILPECFDFADREVALLQESDAHPNVVRYFCTEQDAQFRYIALELCQATLNEFVNDTINIEMDAMQILHEATMGLAHLHSLNIVHRDIKPENVLLSVAGPNGRVRAMISDFGLSKKLQLGRDSFSEVSGLRGTEGWMAPELLSKTERITCAVDVFSLGCVFYYVISGGHHPFGSDVYRQANIAVGNWKMNAFPGSEDKVQLNMSLLPTMINSDPLFRPNCRAVLNHPIFWTSQSILAFLQDVSDRVERSSANDAVLIALERNGEYVVRGDWKQHIDKEVSCELRKYRNYRGNSLCDLLRALRNKRHHYKDLTKDAQQCLGEMPHQFTNYWTTRFPLLLPHTWISMQLLRNEENFRQYYTNFTFPSTLLNYQISAQDAEKFRIDMDEQWRQSRVLNNSTESSDLHFKQSNGGPSVGLFRLTESEMQHDENLNVNRRRYRHRKCSAKSVTPKNDLKSS